MQPPTAFCFHFSLTLYFQSTRLAYLNKDAAFSAAPKVADIMAKELGWSRKEKQQQLQQAFDALSNFGGTIPNKRYLQSQTHTVKTVRDIFWEMDLGGNGFIDLTEFKDCCETLGIPFKTRKEAKKEFDNIDVNQDGKIDENEFVEWWYKSNSRLQLKLADKFKFTAYSKGSGALG